MEELKWAEFSIGKVKVCLTAFDQTRYEVLKGDVLEVLATSHPWLEFEFDQERESGRGYYSGVRFQIYVSDLTGTAYLIVDGGFTDWTQQLLNDRKERLLISGIGSERFIFCFAS